MSQKKSRPVLKWILRLILIMVLAVTIFIVNLWHFKPFSLNHFYEVIFIKFALKNPELLTQMRMLEQFGIRGHNARFSPGDPEFNTEMTEMGEDFYNTLKSYDRDKMTESQKLSSDILAFFLEDSVRGKPFMFHDYPVNQLFGVQSNMPTFMAESHQVNDKTDAKHYLTRLSKFGWYFDGVIEGLHLRQDKGVVPPRFVIDKVLDEMRGFIDTPAKDNIIYTSLKEKLEKVEDISQKDKLQYLSETERLINDEVYPTYQKLFAVLEKQQQIATTDDGVWKLPNGDAYYAFQLRSNTTTDMSAEEIHQLGISEVARIEDEMRVILDGLGHEGKTPGEWLQILAKEERFLYSEDTPTQKILDDYQKIINQIDANLDDWFDVRPDSPVEVRRIPEFKEKTSPGAYYNTPAMDGSRPGIFYANLRSYDEVVKWSMKTLSYHEAIPGHHFQLAIQQELTGLPMFRKIVPFTAYAEGWALYAERLAWEVGAYEGDPHGDLGRLQDEMFRAVRLVVDTGIHHKRWTREQAIEYMTAKTGKVESEVVAEIERYIVMPGQACAYKVGQLKILELRERAKTELGSAFDIKEFHNVILKNGSVPLVILEQLVDAYIEQNKA